MSNKKYFEVHQVKKTKDKRLNQNNLKIKRILYVKLILDILTILSFEEKKKLQFFMNEELIFSIY